MQVSDGPADASSAELGDDDLRVLGKAVGELVQRVMRLRQENGTIAVLSVLAKCGPMRPSDLARQLLLDLSTVSRHAQALERSGLIEKLADPHDGRAMTLHLTADGQSHIERMWERRIDEMRKGLSHWDPAELRTLSGLLTRYADDLGSILASEQCDRTQHQPAKDPLR